MHVTPQGPTGSTADLIIGDLFVPGQQVAYAITGLQPLPGSFGLLQNYPNPFRDRTTIVYEIPEGRVTGLHVNLSIYDVTGRRVGVFVDDVRFPGRYTVTWDAAVDGQPLPSGIYFCRITAGEYEETIPLIRVR
jgi:hypothetical protein